MEKITFEPITIDETDFNTQELVDIYMAMLATIWGAPVQTSKTKSAVLKAASIVELELAMKEYTDERIRS